MFTNDIHVVIGWQCGVQGSYWALASCYAQQLRQKASPSAFQHRVSLIVMIKMTMMVVAVAVIMMMSGDDDDDDDAQNRKCLSSAQN